VAISRASSPYQRQGKHLALFLRGRFETAVITRQVRGVVESVNPALPVFGVEPLSETVAEWLAVRKFSMELIAEFAVTALLLATLGIYGVISYMVSERRHEIGVRITLGAQHGDVMKMVMREGMRLAIAGAAVGLVGTLIVSRAMARLLFGVSPTDPWTFAVAAAVLAAVAALGCSLPARRAVRVDPIAALR